MMGAPQASLAMYALQEVEWATAALWQRIVRSVRQQGLREIPLPADVDQVHDITAVMTKGPVVFAQTCGFPLTHTLSGRVRVLGTPVYDAPGCQGAWYRSVIVARADSDLDDVDSLRGHRVAVNGWDSQSGWNALAAAVAPLATDGQFFSASVVTGSHAASLEAVRGGMADCAAIDCVTFALLYKHRRHAVSGVRVVGETAAAPALPFVTAIDTPPHLVSALRRALPQAMTDLDLAEARGELLLNWIEDVPLSDYDVIIDMAAEAIPPPPVVQV